MRFKILYLINSIESYVTKTWLKRQRKVISLFTYSHQTGSTLIVHVRASQFSNCSCFIVDYNINLSIQSRVALRNCFKVFILCVNKIYNLWWTIRKKTKSIHHLQKFMIILLRYYWTILKLQRKSKPSFYWKRCHCIISISARKINWIWNYFNVFCAFRV